MFRYENERTSRAQPRYTLIAGGRVARGFAVDAGVAWSHEFDDVDLWARGLGGDVVGADELVLNLESQA